VLALAGAIALAVSEFSTIASVHISQGSCEVINDSDPALADRCELSGFERHGGALLLLALLAALMGLGAGLGGSRPAAFALLATGVVTLGIALLVDLPQTDREGLVRGFDAYSNARGEAGTGFYLELLAGAALAAAGALRLWRPGPRPPAPPPRAARRATGQPIA
jgi:hypothetical protein